MHFNMHPLKLYRANRVMDLGDKWLTYIGEELLLPDSQSVRDLEKLGVIEVIQNSSQELNHGGSPMTLRECMEAEECHEEKSKGGVLSSFLRRFRL